MRVFKTIMIVDSWWKECAHVCVHMGWESHTLQATFLSILSGISIPSENCRHFADQEGSSKSPKVLRLEKGKQGSEATSPDSLKALGDLLSSFL